MDVYDYMLLTTCPKNMDLGYMQEGDLVSYSDTPFIPKFNIGRLLEHCDPLRIAVVCSSGYVCYVNMTKQIIKTVWTVSTQDENGYVTTGEKIYG